MTDLLTGHYACLSRLIAWDTFVSAEDLWSHTLWKAHSLGAELQRGSVSSAVEIIFCLKVTIVRIFAQKLHPISTLRNMHK